MSDERDLGLDVDLVQDTGAKISTIASDLDKTRRGEYMVALEQRGSPWGLDPMGKNIGANYIALKSQWLKALRSAILRLQGVGYDISKVGKEFDEAKKQIEKEAEGVGPGR